MLDLKKQYQTRVGNPVRLFMLDGGGAYPVLGAYRPIGNEDWISMRWQKGGMQHTLHSDPLDLIEVKPRIQLKRWVNIYIYDKTNKAYLGGCVFDTERDGKFYSNTAGYICTHGITIDIEDPRAV